MALDPEPTLAEQARLVDALALRLAAQDGGPVQRFETHASWVLVGPRQAWKLKKALRLPFLDFSTVERRGRCCAEELRLNRRHAPGLYRAVRPVTGTLAAPRLGGPGAVLDHVLVMQAFPQDALWDRLAARGALTPARVDDLAQRLADFHAAAAVAPADGPFGRATGLRQAMADNLEALGQGLTANADRDALAALRLDEARAWAPQAARVERRRAQGRVRECHGDLHLGNIVQLGDVPTPFDGIEFNDDFRWIDVAGDAAFVAMDLHAHGLPALAHRFVDAWLQASGDADAAPWLPWLVAHRALVRAKVALLRAAQAAAPAHEGRSADGAADGAAGRDAARRGIALARAVLQPAARGLILMHGLSGSGKTTWSQALLEASGALRLRADVERKRLAGLPAAARSGCGLGLGLYTPQATAATYERLETLAASALADGLTVILDASFLGRDQRARALAVAREAGVPGIVVALQADAATLRRRILARAAEGRDASEADLAVLDAQQARVDAPAPGECDALFRVDATPAPDAGTIERILGARRAPP